MRESISRRVVGITACLLTAAPASALACPVCAFVGTSDNTWAYQAMTAMLTLLPLAMVGATVWWLTRLAARADMERPSATHNPSTTHRSVGTETYSVSQVRSVRLLPDRRRWAVLSLVRLKPDATYEERSLALSEGQVRRGRAVDG
jgi:hypothetical protein